MVRPVVLAPAERPEVRLRERRKRRAACQAWAWSRTLCRSQRECQAPEMKRPRFLGRGRSGKRGISAPPVSGRMRGETA